MAGERDRERERGYQQSVGDLCQLVDGWRERERERGYQQSVGDLCQLVDG